MPRISYVNGRFVPHHQASVHIEDRGFQFADGVYAVIALLDGRMIGGEGHLAKLEKSLEELGIRAPMTRRAMQLVLQEVIRRNRIKNAAIYIQVTRGAAARNYACPPGVSPTMVVTMRPMTFDITARKAVAKKVVTVPDMRWARRDMKTLMLLAQVLARRTAAAAGGEDAWLVDGDGYVTEGASNNAWIVDANGALITRPAERGIIFPGMLRSTLQGLCKKAGLKIIERPFTVAEAYKAKEAFATGSVLLIAPVVEIDGKKIGDGKMGPVTEKVIDLYFSHMLGKKKAA